MYFYGQKLQLKCNRGYELKGESYVQCLASGEWSRNISNCSSNIKSTNQFDSKFCSNDFARAIFLFVGISCSKPELPDDARILHGSTYLYSDKIVISCANGKTVEIYCNADGQWSLDPRLVCHR